MIDEAIRRPRRERARPSPAGPWPPLHLAAGPRAGPQAESPTGSRAGLHHRPGPSECGRDRPGFGWHAVSEKLCAIQYYRVLNIINLKLCNVYNVL